MCGATRIGFWAVPEEDDEDSYYPVRVAPKEHAYLVTPNHS